MAGELRTADHLDHLAVAQDGELGEKLWLAVPGCLPSENCDDPVVSAANVDQFGPGPALGRRMDERKRLVAVVACARVSGVAAVPFHIGVKVLRYGVEFAAECRRGSRARPLAMELGTCL